MSHPIRTIHVGVGNRGTWPLDVATAENGFELVALVDKNQEALAEAQKRVGAVPAFSSLAAAVAAVDAEAAILCTPTHLHVPMGIEALDAGLHVLVEKGMAPTLAESQALVSSAEKHRRVLCVAQNYRYNADIQTLHRVIHDRTDPHWVGTPWLLDFVQHRCRPVPRNLTYPHAAIWDMSCHHFDNFLYLLGDGLNLVHAMEYQPAFSAYPYANNNSFHFKHSNGCTVLYTHTHDAGFATTRTIIYGEHGSIIQDESGTRFSKRGEKNFQKPAWETVPPSEGLDEKGVIRDFWRAVREGAEPGIIGKRNLAVMRLCHETSKACEQTTSRLHRVPKERGLT